MSTSRTRTIAELGLAIALFAVLQWVFKIKLPININGGSISLGMLPIIVVALRRGPVAGVVVGALCGFMDLLFDPYVIHPAQLVLDYPIAFGLVGLSGVFAVPARRLQSSAADKLGVAAIVAGSIVGGLGRFAASFASGIIFFSEYAKPGQPVWIYSAVYNLGYLAPSVAACAMLALVLVPILARVVPVAGEPVEGGFHVHPDGELRA